MCGYNEKVSMGWVTLLNVSQLLVQKAVVGKMRENTYFLDANDNCILIDPGSEGNFIYQKIQRKCNNKNISILATHGHFDHIGAIPYLLDQNPKISVYISKKDKFFYSEKLYGVGSFTGLVVDLQKYKKNLVDITQFDQISFGNLTFNIINLPGHTPGSVGYYCEENKMIFVGDTLFKGAVGGVHFPKSSPSDLVDSLSKLVTLPNNTIVYPGHMMQTTIGREKANNPYLKRFGYENL